MNITIEPTFNGREILYTVCEDRRIVARFRDEAEAVQWARDEYGEDFDEYGEDSE